MQFSGIKFRIISVAKASASFRKCLAAPKTLFSKRLVSLEPKIFSKRKQACFFSDSNSPKNERRCEGNFVKDIEA